MERQAEWIDELLASGRRTLRTHPTKCLLGSTGARLWADVLELTPGFEGAVDFIHKMNLPLLFAVDCSAAAAPFQSSVVEWKPSHLSVTFDHADFRFGERKFIAWDDVAVSCQTWENRSDEVLELKLRFHPAIIQQHDREAEYTGVWDSDRGFAVRTTVRASRPELGQGLRVKPGETVDFVVAAALGVEGPDGCDTLAYRAGRYAAGDAEGGDGPYRARPLDRIVAEQQREYGQWFDSAPLFQSDDPLLDKTWAYRWYLMRHNLADPKYGLIQEPLFYEGRSHKMTKTPFKPEGWEFSKLIPLTQPMHLLEARWHRDSRYGRGIFRNMAAAQGEDGRYNCLYADGVLPHSYANFMGWASYQYYLIHRDKEAVVRMLPSLKRQVLGEAGVFGSEHDALLIEYDHKKTGKEYQPSYWYFHGYPKDCMDPDGYTPLKRVDRSVYHYLNSRGVAALCEAAGDPDAERFRELAGKIETDILSKMWEESEAFFFDLHHATDEKALVKNIVGFYPMWAEIVDDSHEALVQKLLDPELFRTSCPFPSVALDCPIYTAEGGWQGQFIKGRNGCVWNGPAWPYTNSIVLDGLAAWSKRRGHACDKEFGELLREFAWLHYSQRDMSKPYLVEHYNSRTGEAISDDVDYNHSYFIDLVLRHVAGLQVKPDRIVLDPVDIGLTHFEASRIYAAGKELRITYAKPGRGPASLPRGYALYIDGELAASSDKLEKLEVLL